MDPSHVILGPVVTEKAERLKAKQRTYTLRVAPRATKVDVAHALKALYDVDVESVRVLWTRPKARLLGQNAVMEKRHAAKRALVRLTPKSRSLDLAAFATR
jgi:large subunit ribosomal protein L23